MFSDLTFNLEFQKDEESGWFTVHVVELPGCVSQGATVDEARANIADALSTYLDVVFESALRGQPSPQPLPAPAAQPITYGQLSVHPRFEVRV